MSGKDNHRVRLLWDLSGGAEVVGVGDRGRRRSRGAQAEDQPICERLLLILALVELLGYDGGQNHSDHADLRVCLWALVLVVGLTSSDGDSSSSSRVEGDILLGCGEAKRQTFEPGLADESGRVDEMIGDDDWQGGLPVRVFAVVTSEGTQGKKECGRGSENSVTKE